MSRGMDSVRSGNCRNGCRALLLCSTLALASACSPTAAAGPPTGFCTAPRSIAVSVEVRDSITARAIADSASGTVRRGSAVDTLARQDSLIMLGGDSTGTYDVVVQRPGYATWSRTGVAVTQTGVCGNVVPTALVARLMRSP